MGQDLGNVLHTLLRIHYLFESGKSTVITGEIYCIETPGTFTSEFTIEGLLSQSSQLPFQQEGRIKVIDIRKSKDDDFVKLENFIRKACLKKVQWNSVEERSRGALLSNGKLLRHSLYWLAFGVISSI